MSNIIGCHLKKNHHILIILDTNILTQLVIKWLFKFPPYPVYATALPGKSQTSKICIKVNEKAY